MLAIPDSSSTQADKGLWHRWRPWLIVSSAVLATLALLALALVVLPPLLVPPGRPSFAELAKAESDIRGNLVAALGVLAVLIGAVVGFLNLRETQKHNRLARQRDREQLELTRRGQIADRFSKAIEQLGQNGDERVDVRIGAIYSLEQIARDSPDDLHGPVMETLTAFLRGHSNPLDQEDRTGHEEDRTGHEEVGAPVTPVTRWVPNGNVRLRADFQAIATVIGRRDLSRETQSLDLTGVELRGAVLYGARLQRVRLWNAHLEGASLRHAHLEGAELMGAHLEGAHLSLAHMEGALLWHAHLEGAELHAVHLEGARLESAHLPKANLMAAHLQKAWLMGAHLEGALLWQARLERANLDGAYMQKAKLAEAHLEEASLRYTHLEAAILQSAHLEGADLSEAHLEGADLDFAYLKGAKLRHRLVDESDATGLTWEQLKLASRDQSTELPSYLQEAVSPDVR